MEESDQKATALKRAYAEMILNTAKESASRVMFSDRKSASFHEDLTGTKEESLRLLVRLKHMVDAKTIEAEITSTNQQRQIDVLEAQLQEAEDIITDLRSELRWVRDKLEKARVNELSRNGCTQRIHALERKTSSSGNEEEQCITEKGSEENLSSGNKRCLVLALRPSNAEVITKAKTSKLRGKRKRRWSKRKLTSVKSQSQLIKPCQSQPDILCSKTSMENSDCEDSVENHLAEESQELDALKHLQHKRTLYSGDISIIRKEKMSKNIENLACKEPKLVSMNVDDGESKAVITENKTERNNVDPSNAVTISVNEENRSTGKDLKSRNEDVLVSCDSCEVQEDSVVAKTGSELVNRHIGSKVVEVVSEQLSESLIADGNRLVKYTFQRKRKKGPLSENYNNTNFTGKREAEEEVNNAQHQPIESTMGNELSRETPQVAKVVTQLESLSES
ncbi:unnamed protein product [Cochlearia groenlandica]